jgi:hypothetical protein
MVRHHYYIMALIWQYNIKKWNIWASSNYQDLSLDPITTKLVSDCVIGPILVSDLIISPILVSHLIISPILV